MNSSSYVVGLVENLQSIYEKVGEEVRAEYAGMLARAERAGKEATCSCQGTRSS